MFFRQTAPFPDTVQDMLFQLGNFALVHLGNTLEAVFHAELVVLLLAHGVVGEDIERLEVLKSADKIA